VSGWLLDRRLRATQARLARARAQLDAARAELGVLAEQSDEDDLRALVSEAPFDRSEARDTSRHSSRAQRQAAALAEEVRALERRIDELLDQRGLGG
jgi:chromosome segregation ATPase